MLARNVPLLCIVTLFTTPVAYAEGPDPWATFNPNIKACTLVDKVYNALPSKNQDSLLTFCNSFVGYSTTTVTGQTDVWVTTPIPLRTVTVSSNLRPRFDARSDGQRYHLDRHAASPTPRRTVAAVHDSTITPAPLASAQILVQRAQKIERAKSKEATPALFVNQASLFIRTGCACLGFSTQYTLPIFTTTTATSTVPASCARAPVSAYRVDSYSPASALAVAYDYGWFDIYEPSPDPLEECCKSCQGRGGCVQFVYEKLDFAKDGAYARCSYLYFDDYDGNTVTGVPRLANEQSFSCPNGYLAVNGLVPDTSSTTITSATFLGPCAVTTVRAR